MMAEKLLEIVTFLRGRGASEEQSIGLKSKSYCYEYKINWLIRLVSFLVSLYKPERDLQNKIFLPIISNQDI